MAGQEIGHIFHLRHSPSLQKNTGEAPVGTVELLSKIPGAGHSTVYPPEQLDEQELSTFIRFRVKAPPNQALLFEGGPKIGSGNKPNVCSLFLLQPVSMPAKVDRKARLGRPALSPPTGSMPVMGGMRSHFSEKE